LKGQIGWHAITLNWVLALCVRRSTFAPTHLLARLVGHIFIIKINMSNTDFDLENVIHVMEANLRDEQKQAMAKAMEDYKQLCLKSFSINRSGEVIQKEALPMPRQITFEANPGKLQEMVDSAINHALINQSSVLSNTVFNAVARTFKEGQVPPAYVGLAYHLLGSSSVTAPSATTVVAGT